MKKTVLTSTIIVGYFILMITMGIVASVPASVHKSFKENIGREISHHIICPSFITENSEANVVRVLFQVDPSGKLNVLEVGSPNAQLRDYVTGELKNITINYPETSEKFVVMIKFRVV